MGGARTLFHYTTEESQSGILKSQRLNQDFGDVADTLIGLSKDSDRERSMVGDIRVSCVVDGFIAKNRG